MQRIVGHSKMCRFLTKCKKINCMCAVRLHCKDGLSMAKQRSERRLLKTFKTEMIVA